MEYGGHKVSRAAFEMALYEKQKDSDFTSDISPLLSEGSNDFNFSKTFDDLERRLITLVPGTAWSGPQKKSKS